MNFLKLTLAAFIAVTFSACNTTELDSSPIEIDSRNIELTQLILGGAYVSNIESGIELTISDSDIDSFDTESDLRLVIFTCNSEDFILDVKNVYQSEIINFDFYNSGITDSTSEFSVTENQTDIGYITAPYSQYEESIIWFTLTSNLTIDRSIVCN